MMNSHSHADGLDGGIQSALSNVLEGFLWCMAWIYWMEGRCEDSSKNRQERNASCYINGIRTLFCFVFSEF